MHMHSRLHTELDTCRALQSCKSLYACFDAMQMFLRMLGPCLHAALTRLYTLRYFMELFARRGLACAPQGHHTRLANIHTLSLSLCDCMSLPVAFEKATLAGWQGVNGAQTSFAMRARTHTHNTHWFSVHTLAFFVTCANEACPVPSSCVSSPTSTSTGANDQNAGCARAL